MRRFNLFCWSIEVLSKLKVMALTTYQEQEILEQRNNSQLTRRAVVSELENILYEPMPLLDHGFIRVIDYMGNDTAVVQAARVSYGTGTK